MAKHKSTRLSGRETLINLRVLPQGIPSLEAHQQLMCTSLFNEMESFSKTFAAEHLEALKGYSNRWIADSFHLWSRQWEYPFTFSYIEEFIRRQRREKEIAILDAGSGCTFFPYFINEKCYDCQVYCCDNDPSLNLSFEKINKTRRQVEFAINDLECMRYENDFFDIVYCVSVLEHTKEPDKIVDEFRRILRTGGLLILTFDVSLDNRTQISVEGARNLLRTLDITFEKKNFSAEKRFLSDIRRKDILTTNFVREFGDRELLPWRLTWGSVRNQLTNLQVPRKPFFNITVFCSTWKN